MHFYFFALCFTARISAKGYEFKVVCKLFTMLSIRRVYSQEKIDYTLCPEKKSLQHFLHIFGKLKYIC